MIDSEMAEHLFGFGAQQPEEGYDEWSPIIKDFCSGTPTTMSASVAWSFLQGSTSMGEQQPRSLPITPTRSVQIGFVEGAAAAASPSSYHTATADFDPFISSVVMSPVLPDTPARRQPPPGRRRSLEEEMAFQTQRGIKHNLFFRSQRSLPLFGVPDLYLPDQQVPQPDV
jgi:hypothetical protein